MATTGREIQEALIARAITNLQTIREERPRVHCLTNPVAQNLSANVLLAAGAVPSMTADAEVIEDFVESTAALVINLGMLDDARKASIPLAISTAKKLGRPWVLDPVKIDRSSRRLGFAKMLLRQGPDAVRCNLSEEPVLFGEDRDFAGVVAVTGPSDRVVRGNEVITIDNGHPLMDRVTAMGCAATALTGAFLAVDDNAFLAVASGLLIFAIAGEKAAARASGPGSFVPELLDCLYMTSAQDIEKMAKIQ